MPQEPAFATPIAEPKAQPGDDARVAYHEMRAAFREQTAQLADFRDWYRGVRKRYKASNLK